MKIGVALSGCDIGGVTAAHVLHDLRDLGIRPAFLSVSGTAAPAALLYLCGRKRGDCEKQMAAFLDTWKRADPDQAIAELADTISPDRLTAGRNFSINALDTGVDQAIAFTNDFSFDSPTLCTWPVDDPYAILSSAMGAVDGLRSFPCRGRRLCDYSVRFGCPIFPLRLSGCDRILSFSFLPEHPRTPYEILIAKNTAESAPGTDFHAVLSFPGTDKHAWDMNKYSEIASEKIQNCKNDIVQMLAK